MWFPRRNTISWRKVYDMLGHAHPLFDVVHAYVVYYDRQPLAASSAYVDISEATHPGDLVALPAWAEEGDGTWTHSGKWSIYYCGDLDYLAPSMAVPPAAFSFMQPPPQPIRLCIAALNAARPSNTKVVATTDSGKLLHGSGTMCRALGYDRDDFSWVPETWWKPCPPGVLETGVDVVLTGDDEALEARIRWHRMRLADFRCNLYMVDVLTVDDNAFDQWHSKREVTSWPPVPFRRSRLPALLPELLDFRQPAGRD